MPAKAPLFVTGASGYVGGHFLREARRRRWRLRCLARAPSHRRGGRVRWIQGDLCRKGKWERSLKGCRAVIHLATASLLECERDPAAAAAVILDGTRRLLDAARRAGVKRVIFASSSEVYGDPPRLPVRESDPLSPLSIYGFLKACAEILVLRHAASACVLRFFNLYGEAVDGRPRETVLNLFARRILAGEAVAIDRSPKNSRDFLHVQDAAQALAAAINREEASGVINIGSGCETRLLAAARKIGAWAGHRAHPKIRSGAGRLRRMRAATRRAQALLDFSPRQNFDDGLRQTLRAERARLHACRNPSSSAK